MEHEKNGDLTGELLVLVLNWHTTLFQRLYNVIWMLWSLDGRCFKVLYQLTLYSMNPIEISHFGIIFSYQSLYLYYTYNTTTSALQCYR